MQSKLLRFLASPWVIFAVALALRVAFITVEAHRVPAEALATVPFQNEAGSIAFSLAHGDGFCCLFRQPTGPTAWLAPVFPLFLAMLFKLFGAFTVGAFYAAALSNALFSALACFPIFCVARRIGGSKFLAVCAAWIWALFPSGILMPFEWIWDTSLSALLASTLLWATFEFERTYSRRNAAVYGLLWGLALLTNPALGSLLPFLLGWVVYRQNHKRPSGGNVRLATLALGVAIVCCLPWTIRNAVQFHRLVPLRSNFAFELWIGNNEVFDEHSRALNRITRFEQVRRYEQLGESAFLDEKWQQVTMFFREHPGLAATLFLNRVVVTWMGTATPWRDFRGTGSALVRFLFLWNGVTVIGIVAALTRLYRARSPFLLPLAVFPLVFPILYYITHTSLRYRHPCDPVIALLLAIALIGVTNPNAPNTRGAA